MLCASNLDAVDWRTVSVLIPQLDYVSRKLEQHKMYGSGIRAVVF